MLIGRLGSDVKLTYFEKDSCVGQVSLATDESYTDKTTQQKVENTQWHNIVLYNKLAEPHKREQLQLKEQLAPLKRQLKRLKN